MKNKVFVLLILLLPAFTGLAGNNHGSNMLPAECEADFSFSYVPTTPIYIQFTDLSAGDPDRWLWLFGDGTTSTEQNPVHPYYQAGTYTVCLIIEHSDSLNYCMDSICKTLIIPDSLNCEADFTYEVDPDDPMKVHFIDLSSGNITDYKWDFGDGNISSEQNPVHTFPGPTEYLVCLRVENSDTAEPCLHFICETIVLEDSNFCTAGFAAVADSSSQVMYQYSFYDQSSGNPDLWSWTFGDGTVSHEQHPVHIFENPGTYEVCLQTWNSNFPGCTDSYCILVKTASYFQLGGLAFIGDNPINNPVNTGDTGRAMLYRQQGQNMVAVDTNDFYELGYYWFSNKMEMGYRVKIGLSPGSVHYSDYIPVYYPDAIRWQDAEFFMLTEDLYEMNASLQKAEGVENGPGMISGVIAVENRNGVESHRSFSEVPVFLCNSNNVPLAWSATNEYGEFAFKDIAFGTYTLYADLISYWSESVVVSISQGFPVIDNTRIKMHLESPFAVDDHTPGLRLTSLYPNPVGDHMVLEVRGRETSQAAITIINTTGKLVFHEQAGLEKGFNSIKLNTADLPPGLYMLNLIVENDNGIVTKKFIKK